ncbi:GNAT family N-acetyltransferase [Tissierella sp. MSJ-40]|uniref:GNAT family N-acetyltransferase n=1 Tax=Tissierella simiarum TaxID=2841534 RepID=A0ABS6E374_9FIRM|nr:GNAT family N-acetyltransferase [Tissierella simiarum]MBU5437276.1 GNAT family N-acetyltransferase [Tissierella simiarum]
MNEIKVLEFNMEMLDECVDLYMKVYSQEPWNEKWESRDVVEKFIKSHQKNSNFLSFIAIKDSKVVGVSIGFIKPWIQGEEYYIDEFFIDTDIQRQGVGAKLMSKIKESLKQKDINAIILNTQRDFPSHKFYEHIGFNVHEGLIILSTTF